MQSELYFTYNSIAVDLWWAFVEWNDITAHVMLYMFLNQYSDERGLRFSFLVLSTWSGMVHLVHEAGTVLVLSEQQTWIFFDFWGGTKCDAARSTEEMNDQGNSSVKVCKGGFGTSFISRQETSDSCLQFRYKELKLHAGEGLLSSRGQEKGSVWKIEGDWSGGQSTSVLPPQLLHQPTMCTL